MAEGVSADRLAEIRAHLDRVQHESITEDGSGAPTNSPPARMWYVEDVTYLLVALEAK